MEAGDCDWPPSPRETTIAGHQQQADQDLREQHQGLYVKRLVGSPLWAPSSSCSLGNGRDRDRVVCARAAAGPRADLLLEFLSVRRAPRAPCVSPPVAGSAGLTRSEGLASSIQRCPPTSSAITLLGPGSRISCSTASISKSACQISVGEVAFPHRIAPELLAHEDSAAGRVADRLDRGRRAGGSGTCRRALPCRALSSIRMAAFRRARDRGESAGSSRSGRRRSVDLREHAEAGLGVGEHDLDHALDELHSRSW